MKKTFFLLILLNLFFFASCKKDYPNDIPEWIKTIIKNCKKHGCCYNYGGSLWIDELKNKYNDSLIYEFSGRVNPVEYDYYDYNGNLICTGGYSAPGISYQNMILKRYSLLREIWHEDTDRCR